MPAGGSAEGAPYLTGARMSDGPAGGIGGLLPDVAWERTPVGPPATWPASLVTAVRIVLASPSAMWIAWGPELTFLCNEAFRRGGDGRLPVTALGRPAAEVWARDWPAVAPHVEEVLRSGRTSVEEATLSLVGRDGTVQEIYRTLSFGPLPDDDGHPVGVLCVVSEDTDRVIAERRMTTVLELGAALTGSRAEVDVLDVVHRHLGANAGSLPFTATYLFDGAGDSVVARLACVTGLDVGHPAAPASLRPGDVDGWPVAEALAGRAVLVDRLQERFPGLPVRASREPPTQALVVPLSHPPGGRRPVGFLVAGLNRYRPLDDGYRGFIETIAGQIAVALAAARAGGAGPDETAVARRQSLLDQAEQLAQMGSWEIDLATAALTGSLGFHRILGVGAQEMREVGPAMALRHVHAADRAGTLAALHAAARDGTPLDIHLRIDRPRGGRRIVRLRGVLHRDGAGRKSWLRGSLQDVTEQHEAERARRAAAVAADAAAREHRIADELQGSLLPARSFDPDHLEVATYYRAGVAGTQVGGDWYDVIELGAGRTALVIGDVMGRGVRAAAVMGQLRTAVRAYARLDMPPADVLELLDGVVRDLGEDQIVTCVYAVYDPADRTLTYANAGHLPPLYGVPGAVPSAAVRLTAAAGPPLGTGPLTLEEERVPLPVGAVVALYTDGLVERRDRDIDEGVDALAARLGETPPGAAAVPAELVSQMLPGEQDDDVAVLLARVPDESRLTMSALRQIPPTDWAVPHAREFAATTLRSWALPDELVDDVVLLVSELVTNAVVHGRPPIEMRLRRAARQVVLEVFDGATFLPRRLRPSLEDEHGRGLQLVALLAERWGTRPTQEGKSVWCMFPLPADATAGAPTERGSDGVVRPDHAPAGVTSPRG